MTRSSTVEPDPHDVILDDLLDELTRALLTGRHETAAHHARLIAACWTTTVGALRARRPSAAHEADR